jgi:hypothetical protein
VKIKRNNISVCFSYPVFAFLRRGLNPQEELSKALMRAWAKLGEP